MTVSQIHCHHVITKIIVAKLDISLNRSVHTFRQCSFSSLTSHLVKPETDQRNYYRLRGNPEVQSSRAPYSQNVCTQKIPHTRTFLSCHNKP